MWRVPLSPADLRRADDVAFWRNRQSSKYPNRYGPRQRIDELEANKRGCRGEIALSIVTGIHWDGALGDYGAKDVGPFNVRCRFTPYLPPERWDLPVYTTDKDDDRFVLALDKSPIIELVGWVFATEAKLPHYWQTRLSPAWLLPQRKLLPMEALWAGLDEHASRH